jgi:hypothetical protein
MWVEFDHVSELLGCCFPGYWSCSRVQQDEQTIKSRNRIPVFPYFVSTVLMQISNKVNVLLHSGVGESVLGLISTNSIAYHEIDICILQNTQLQQGE